ncbi:TPA: hypothetical protein QDC03_006195 [Burkholderia cepacia]|uniref:hypothetical protein n=1 Tax=Burkholderia cepacia TaxID=292 RepID=UPI0011B20D41|nr:hypothetical protein [Burkholderia cepacia]HDR9511006.1 hypothetical protein [Burkholderia cepacia]
MSQIYPEILRCNNKNQVMRYLADLAAAQGATLLSTQWMGERGLYEFRCARNHLFASSGSVLLCGALRCVSCMVEDGRRRRACSRKGAFSSRTS